MGTNPAVAGLAVGVVWIASHQPGAANRRGEPDTPTDAVKRIPRDRLVQMREQEAGRACGLRDLFQRPKRRPDGLILEAVDVLGEERRERVDDEERRVALADGVLEV